MVAISRKRIKHKPVRQSRKRNNRRVGRRLGGVGTTTMRIEMPSFMKKLYRRFNQTTPASPSITDSLTPTNKESSGFSTAMLNSKEVKDTILAAGSKIRKSLFTAYAITKPAIGKFFNDAIRALVKKRCFKDPFYITNLSSFIKCKYDKFILTSVFESITKEQLNMIFTKLENGGTHGKPLKLLNYGIYIPNFFIDFNTFFSRPDFFRNFNIEGENENYKICITDPILLKNIEMMNAIISDKKSMLDKINDEKYINNLKQVVKYINDYERGLFFDIYTKKIASSKTIQESWKNFTYWFIESLNSVVKTKYGYRDVLVKANVNVNEKYSTQIYDPITKRTAEEKNLRRKRLNNNKLEYYDVFNPSRNINTMTNEKIINDSQSGVKLPLEYTTKENKKLQHYVSISNEAYNNEKIIYKKNRTRFIGIHGVDLFYNLIEQDLNQIYARYVNAEKECYKYVLNRINKIKDIYNQYYGIASIEKIKYTELLNRLESIYAYYNGFQTVLQKIINSNKITDEFKTELENIRDSYDSSINENIKELEKEKNNQYKLLVNNCANIIALLNQIINLPPNEDRIQIIKDGSYLKYTQEALEDITNRIKDTKESIKSYENALISTPVIINGNTIDDSVVLEDVCTNVKKVYTYLNLVYDYLNMPKAIDNIENLKSSIRTLVGKQVEEYTKVLPDIKEHYNFKFKFYKLFICEFFKIEYYLKLAELLKKYAFLNSTIEIKKLADFNMHYDGKSETDGIQYFNLLDTMREVNEIVVEIAENKKEDETSSLDNDSWLYSTPRSSLRTASPTASHTASPTASPPPTPQSPSSILGGDAYDEYLKLNITTLKENMDDYRNSLINITSQEFIDNLSKNNITFTTVLSKLNKTTTKEEKDKIVAEEEKNLFEKIKALYIGGLYKDEETLKKITNFFNKSNKSKIDDLYTDIKSRFDMLNITISRLKHTKEILLWIKEEYITFFNLRAEMFQNEIIYPHPEDEVYKKYKDEGVLGPRFNIETHTSLINIINKVKIDENIEKIDKMIECMQNKSCSEISEVNIFGLEELIKFLFENKDNLYIQKKNTQLDKMSILIKIAKTMEKLKNAEKELYEYKGTESATANTGNGEIISDNEADNESLDNDESLDNNKSLEMHNLFPGQDAVINEQNPMYPTYPITVEGSIKGGSRQETEQNIQTYKKQLQTLDEMLKTPEVKKEIISDEAKTPDLLKNAEYNRLLEIVEIINKVQVDNPTIPIPTVDMKSIVKWDQNDLSKYSAMEKEELLGGYRKRYSRRNKRVQNNSYTRKYKS